MIELLEESDEAREERIRVLVERFNASTDAHISARLWNELREAINSRSQQQVARMEKEKGLL